MAVQVSEVLSQEPQFPTRERVISPVGNDAHPQSLRLLEPSGPNDSLIPSPILVEIAQCPQIFPPVAITKYELDREVAEVNALMAPDQNQRPEPLLIAVPAQVKKPAPRESRIDAIGKAIEETINMGDLGLSESSINRIPSTAPTPSATTPVLRQSRITIIGNAIGREVEKFKRPPMIASAAYKAVDQLRTVCNKGQVSTEFPKGRGRLQRVRDWLDTTV